MNGATALDCEKMISNPNKTNTTTIGTNQYFFSCLRNDQNSDRTRPLLIERLLYPTSPEQPNTSAKNGNDLDTDSGTATTRWQNADARADLFRSTATRYR